MSGDRPMSFDHMMLGKRVSIEERVIAPEETGEDLTEPGTYAARPKELWDNEKPSDVLADVPFEMLGKRHLADRDNIDADIAASYPPLDVVVNNQAVVGQPPIAQNNGDGANIQPSVEIMYGHARRDRHDGNHNGQYARFRAGVKVEHGGDIRHVPTPRDTHIDKKVTGAILDRNSPFVFEMQLLTMYQHGWKMQQVIDVSNHAQSLGLGQHRLAEAVLMAKYDPAMRYLQADPMTRLFTAMEIVAYEARPQR